MKAHSVNHVKGQLCLPGLLVKFYNTIFKFRCVVENHFGNYFEKLF